MTSKPFQCGCILHSPRRLGLSYSIIHLSGGDPASRCGVVVVILIGEMKSCFTETTELSLHNSEPVRLRCYRLQPRSLAWLFEFRVCHLNGATSVRLSGFWNPFGGGGERTATAVGCQMMIFLPVKWHWLDAFVLVHTLILLAHFWLE